MATECWPDRTLGDNRMWFEAKSEKKKKKKKKRGESQAGFLGRAAPLDNGNHFTCALLKLPGAAE